MVWAHLTRYVLFAVVALALGIAINLTMGNGLGGQNFLSPSFYLLLLECGIFHVIALSSVRISSMIFEIRIRSVLYFSVSVIGFLASMYLLSPTRYGGIHLLTICWASLALISLDYLLRASRRPQPGEPSS